MPLSDLEQSRMARPGFGLNALCVSSGMMEESPGYGAWIAKTVSTHLRGNVLEVGCGFGHYSMEYAKLSRVTTLTAVDIEPKAIAFAVAHATHPKIQFLCANALQLSANNFDSLVCANVIEHVPDDVEFTQSLLSTLRPGGTAAFLVPAHEWLYTQYDVEAGHFRRYSARRLRTLVEKTGYIIDSVHYFNAIGALGWWYAFKARQTRVVTEATSRGLIRVFDRYCLPFGRILEFCLRPPFGLSVIALCRRPL